MATYYVSAGSVSTNWAAATNSGTPATVATAMTNAAAGDIVRFQTGDYFPPNAPNDFQPSWRPTNSGTSGNPITFISDVRHGAVIHDAADQTSNAANRTGFGSYNVDWIVFDGFSIVSDLVASTILAVRHPFMINCTTNTHVQNFLMTGWAHSDHTNGASIGVYGDTRDSTNVYIHHNDISGPTNDLSPTEAVVNASGIYIFEANNIYVYNNTIHDCNNGVSWKTSPSSIYAYNNYLYNINRSAFYITPEVTLRTTYHVHHNLMVNVNRFFDTEEAPSGGGTFTDFRVWNNTLYNNASTPLGVVYVAPSGTANVSGILMGQDGGFQTARGAQFYNNIIMTNTTSRGWEIHDDLTSDGMLGTPFNYNCYRAQSGTMRYIYNATNTTSFTTYQTAINDDGEEANSITTNPSFVNAGGTTVEDYKLAGGSPCLGTGSGSVDMGCWQGQTAIGNMAEPTIGTVTMFI